MPADPDTGPAGSSRPGTRAARAANPAEHVRVARAAGGRATRGRGTEPPQARRPGHGGRASQPVRAAGLTSRAGRVPGRSLLPGEPDGSSDRFGLLLLVLIATYVISAFLASAWVNALQIVLFVAVAALALRTGRVRQRTARQSIMTACAGSVIAVVLALTRTDAGAGLASLWTGLVLLFTVVLIVRRVLAHSVITLQSLFGAVSAYLILGLMFAAFYGAIDRFGGGGFFANGSPANLKTFQYFSFTTLTTLGYGDFTAASSGGQAIAVMEALFGQVFLATLVARLVASFRPQTRDGRPRTRDGRAAPGNGRRGPQSGPRRLMPGRRRSPHRQPAPGTATRTSSHGRARPARK